MALRGKTRKSQYTPKTNINTVMNLPPIVTRNGGKSTATQETRMYQKWSLATMTVTYDTPFPKLGPETILKVCRLC